MKIQNRNLIEKIINYNSLKGLAMDSDITLEAINMKKKITEHQEAYEEASIKVMEDHSKRDESGKAIREVIHQPGGGTGLKYDYIDAEHAQKASEEMMKLDKIEVGLPDGKIDLAKVLALKTSVDQLDFLLLLTKQE